MTVREAVNALSEAALGTVGSVKTSDGVEYVLVPRAAVELLISVVVAKHGDEPEPPGRPVVRRGLLRPGKVPDMPDLHPDQK